MTTTTLQSRFDAATNAAIDLHDEIGDIAASIDNQAIDRVRLDRAVNALDLALHFLFQVEEGQTLRSKHHRPFTRTLP